MIPAELLELDQWVAWRWQDVVDKDGNPRRTKVPVNARNGYNASTTNRNTWSTHDEARAARKDGIGFVVTASDPFCGVDLDHCLRDGKLLEPARSIVARLKSYTEITPSGDGVRVWVKARLTRQGNKKNLEDGMAIEIYDRVRFFTVTGRSGSTTPTEILERQAEIDALHAEYFPEPVRPPQAGPFRGAGLSLSDLDLLTKARAARNGDKFDRLWSGSTVDHNGDDSSADMALLCHLAFWTGKDPVQVDRLFRQSGLFREKWEREDYRVRSINAALERTGDTYTPGGSLEGLQVEPSTEPAQVDDGQDVRGLIEISDLSDAIDRYYDGGGIPGEHPGWDSVSRLYRVARCEWTLITGVPGSGKSTWLDALIFNLIDNRGWKFLICSPEKQPLERHFAELAEKMTGKPFIGPNRIERDELEWAKTFIGQHVFFANPETPTIDGILETASRALSRFGLDGIVVDPYNELEHSRPAKLSETEYISMVLSRLRRFARQHAIHFFLVAHPTKLQKEPRYTEEGKPMLVDGKRVMDYPVPRPYDISGSSHWYNKADNCITVHRDPEGDRHAVQIHIQKIRNRQNGKPGRAFLTWLPDQGGRFADTGIAIEAGREVYAPSTTSISPASVSSFYEPEPPEREPEPAALLDPADPISDRRSQARTSGSAGTLFDPADSGAIAPWEPEDVQVYGGRTV